MLLELTRKETEALLCKKYLFYTNGIPDADTWKEFCLEEQCGTDLGQKLSNAFGVLSRRGYTEVIVIGTDCPGMNSQLLKEAFERLKKYDLVLGPAEDGGYYLIGAHMAHPALFAGISWSSSSVLSETLAAAEDLGLTYTLLPLLPDIDEEKDLIHLPGYNFI